MKLTIIRGGGLAGLTRQTELASEALPPDEATKLHELIEGAGLFDEDAPREAAPAHRIFERVSGHDHIEGTGIGLAIVARAMQQMGGACGVDSVVGEGSSFWLEFASADGPPPTR